MKKIIIGFIILLICGIAALILGYVHIPPDQYAIIHTTIFGFDEKVHTSDTLIWRWEKLLPTVFTLYTFNLAPYEAEITSPIKGSLFPSGNDYAKALGEDFNFSFEISVFLKFAINPDKLLDLSKNGLRPDTLDSWYKDITLKLSDQIYTIILSDPGIFIKLTRNEYIKRIRDILGDLKEFENIILLSVDPKNINIPDYDVYSTLKATYFERLQFQTTMNQELAEAEKKLYLEAIQKEIEIIRNIEKYGEVLTSYPAILDYLHKANKEYIKETIQNSE